MENTCIYNLLKFSYEGDGESDCIMPGLLSGSATGFDALLDLIQKHLTMTNVKTAWASTNENDEHVFYVTYSESFEEEFHHGFKIQRINMATGKIEILTKAIDEEVVTAIQKLVEEILNKG